MLFWAKIGLKGEKKKEGGLSFFFKAFKKKQIGVGRVGNPVFPPQTYFVYFLGPFGREFFFQFSLKKRGVSF